MRQYRLPVGYLGLAVQVKARKGVAPVHQSPQVVFPAAPLCQVAVAYHEGPPGRLTRAAGNACRIHYRSLHNIGRG